MAESMVDGRSITDTPMAGTDTLHRMSDLLIRPGQGGVRAALEALAEDTGLPTAIWWRQEGEVRLAARHPNADGGPDPSALQTRVAEWLETLAEPLVRTSDDLSDGARLASDSCVQVIWPLELEGAERALWMVESRDGSVPDLASAAESLRLGLALEGMRRRQFAEEEAQLQELRSQRQLMERIVDALPVGLYVVDGEYRIVAWNRKRETGTQGVAREDAIGRSVFDVLYRQPQEILREELEDVFTSGEIRHYDVESTASGEPRYYRLTKVPMRLGDGTEVTHVITIGEDVTERKRISERISHAEKLAALGQMVAGVMHEINNPLATITAGAEALHEMVEDEPEAITLLSMVETEVDRCKRIARDLLSFSRPPPSEKGPVDVQETVEETLKLLRHHERFKKIRVQREYVYDLPLVWANQERLIQVFVALALNALDAMEDDGELRVRTEVLDGSEIAVSFIDTGCGIPASELPKIFEPFYTSKPPGKGTGLGLSICYGIIQEHGGRIEVDSTIGVGSNFRVTLPPYSTESETDTASADAASETRE